MEVVAKELSFTAPNDFTDDSIDRMTDDAWSLWSRAEYDYGDSIVPKVVIDSYVLEIEEENERSLR